MRRTILTMILFFAASTMFAQSPIDKGQVQLNAGIGLSSWGIPLYLGLDYGVHKDITIGGEISYRSFNDNWTSHNYHHSIIGISGNGNYHFNSLLNIPTNWDFYAGLNVGFYKWSSPSDYGGTHSSRLGFGGQIGGRYYFSDKFGINLEFGGVNAFTSGKLGISLKL
jgi:outer membrane immunogenic protein